MGQDSHEAVGVLELRSMADAVQHLELDVVMHRRRVASGVHVHESIVLAEQEQGRPLRRRNGEVVVQSTCQIEEHRTRGLGVRTRCLRVRIPLGRERDQAQPQIGIEARRVVQAPLEAGVDEPFGAKETCTSADELTGDRRPHHRREAREAHEVAHPRTQVRQRRVHHHEVRDEVGTARGHADPDDCAHRIPHDHRGTELLEHRGDQASIGGDRGRLAGRACAPEPDEVDRGDRGAEPVGERLPDRFPRQRVCAETVHEQDPRAVERPVGRRRPPSRIHRDAVGVDREPATDRRARTAPPRVVPRHEANLSGGASLSARRPTASAGPECHMV